MTRIIKQPLGQNFGHEIIFRGRPYSTICEDVNEVREDEDEVEGEAR